jgi:uncharacterized protein (UPF0216 family)
MDRERHGRYTEARRRVMMKGGFDEKLLSRTVKALNVHLPAERKTLATLLTEEKPAIQARNGSLHQIMRAELEELAALMPKEVHGQLRLPIYLELTSDYGRGIARVHGKLDCALVRAILGKEHGGGGEDERDDVLFIYRDDVRRLRRRLPTTTEYAFFYSASL